MLPQIFRQDSPVLELTLPPEHQQKLESLLADLPTRSLHRLRFAGLGLPVLAGEEERRGQQVRGQNRRARTARRHPAVHRTLHGELPARQLAGRLVGGAPLDRRRPEKRRERSRTARRKPASPACRWSTCALCVTRKPAHGRPPPEPLTLAPRPERIEDA